MNVFYQRHDENNAPIPNPSSTADNTDPGEGWSNLNYLNFNGDYVRYDEEGNVAPAPQPYQRYDAEGNPVTPAPYVRHDENNVIVPNPPPIPNS